MPMWPTTRTFTDLKRVVQRAFGDESGTQLEMQDIIDFANEGVMAINEENGILKSRSTAASVEGQREYTFPDANISRVESILYASRYLPNMPFQDAQERLGEDDQSGTPQCWFSFGPTFWLWPTPTDGGQIEIFFVRNPDKITGDPEELLPVPDRWFNALRDYILQRAYEMDQDWQAAQVKGEQFQGALNSFSEEESRSQDNEFPVIRDVM